MSPTGVEQTNLYTYRVSWSPEDNESVATVAEFPSLSWLATTPVDALEGIRKVVDEVLEDMVKTGEAPPQPLASRRYSGKFQVRITPEAHRALALAAAEQNVSLNRLVAARLVGS